MTKNILNRSKREYSINPFVQSIFTADPSAHVWPDGRLYVYPSRDIDPARGCDFMDQYHVFSTTDLVNWRDEGEILNSSEVSWGRTEGGFMWAPDCAYRDGKYYFYFPHPSEDDWNKSWKIGVAVSEFPTKNFKEIGYIEGLGGPSMIDPCVFVDDDNQAYIYYGGGGRCEGGLLSENMTSVEGEMHVMEGLRDFHEATWVFKRAGKYYLTYSDNHHGNNNLCYAMSDNPFGPWEDKGVYLAPTTCETSHGSVVEYKGQWLAFYHSDALSLAGTLRSICCDPLYFNEDGTIQLVVQSRNGHLPLDGSSENTVEETEIYGVSEASDLIGVVLESSEEAYQGVHLTGLSGKMNSVTFNNVDGFDTGMVNLGFYYATPDKLAKISLSINGEFVSLVNLPFTGSMQTYDGYANLTVSLRPGKLNSIKVSGAEGDFNLEAISVKNYTK